MLGFMQFSTLSCVGSLIRHPLLVLPTLLPPPVSKTNRDRGAMHTELKKKGLGQETGTLDILNQDEIGK